MTRDERIGMTVGSLIVGLLKTMDQKQQVKASTIKLKQHIRARNIKIGASQDERQDVANICMDSMKMLVEQHQDEESIMQVATFVESMMFSFEKEMIAMYGNQIVDLVLRFCEKQVVDSKLAKDSYELSDDLKNNIRKLIFDRSK
jgi:hypothetical protein